MSMRTIINGLARTNQHAGNMNMAADRNRERDREREIRRVREELRNARLDAAMQQRALQAKLDQSQKQLADQRKVITHFAMVGDAYLEALCFARENWGPAGQELSLKERVDLTSKIVHDACLEGFKAMRDDDGAALRERERVILDNLAKPPAS